MGNIPWAASSEVRLVGQHSAWIEKWLLGCGRKDRDILGGLSPTIIPVSMRNREESLNMQLGAPKHSWAPRIRHILIIIKPRKCYHHLLP